VPIFERRSVEATGESRCWTGNETTTTIHHIHQRAWTKSALLNRKSTESYFKLVKLQFERFEEVVDKRMRKRGTISNWVSRQVISQYLFFEVV
jgi:hypothetical protein